MLRASGLRDNQQANPIFNSSLLSINAVYLHSLNAGEGDEFNRLVQRSRKVL